MKTNIHFWSYITQFSEWKTFQTKVVESFETHTFYSGTYFLESCRLLDNVEKYGTARQATDTM
jgi:UDP-galactopyranose mutase